MDTIDKWLQITSRAMGCALIADLQEKHYSDFLDSFIEDRTKRLLYTPDNEISVCGYLYEDKLVGNVILTDKVDGSKTLCFFKKGSLHGYYIKQKGQDTTLGIMENGKKVGIWWVNMNHGGQVLVKNYDQEESDLFIYPDHKTAFKGQIGEDGTLIKARLVEVQGYSEFRGLLLPVVEETECAETFGLESNLPDSICEHPEICDPYESKFVEVKQSLIPDAGQGLFATQPIKTGRIAAYFNGYKTNLKSWSDYSISLDESTILDIPESCRSISNYQSTLAHKICHSFEPNARYDYVIHPRFGRIRCAVAIKDITVGEEIVSDYKYSWDRAPQWYRNDLLRFLRNVKKIPEASIKSWIKSRKTAGGREAIV